MKIKLTYCDAYYMKAVNFEQTLYNFPITATIDGKIFILPFGNTDTIRYKIEGDTVYFVGENSSLGYISLFTINPSNNFENSVYLSGDDISNEESYSFGILDKETDEQIKILSEYL